MGWQLAPSLQQLLSEINTAYPNRNKGTDGTISGYTYGPGGVVVNPGNLSSHNINAQGYVCALDITTGNYPGGISDEEGYALAERIRIALRDQPRGDPAYAIHQMRPPYVSAPGAYIATANTNWAWEFYRGVDPHTSHIHVSVDWDIPAGGNQSGQADYLTTLPWLTAAGTTEKELFTVAQYDEIQKQQGLTHEKINAARDTLAGIGAAVVRNARQDQLWHSQTHGKLNAVTQMVIELSKKQGASFTQDQITQWAKEGAAAALAESVVNVDVTVNDKTAQPS